ncbi:sensor domain-containing diguanylate cyclase [Paracraurococcus lichenis]|uniref:Sensor domain-containing diguanylate cyclase n=1 Tax=Paracraurococcus lichenis TaxID=3064888 RepID=A0ABT9E2E9_9PROT|nr:sensor domain-containing diguanylate cyclase [Paracraurococcus sp. LOR1-02]MDO9710329.1 sensor domain-containing diguanylate cyclase [Paracraurococcus sp. LOR1-02]
MPAIAPLPPDEAARLAALRGFEILDTPPDPRFDLFTRLAARTLGTPLAAINLVDDERTWYKSTLGFRPYEPARATSICAHAVGLGEPVMVLEDAAQDPRFADHPMVTGPLGLRFYAGALLRTPEGHALGTLCIGDTVPRRLEEAARQTLLDLASGVGAMLELHRTALRLHRAATLDHLTGLANRAGFEQALGRAVAGALRGAPCALLCLDLDRFKAVNDTHGHAAGDAMLREVARRIGATLRQSDLAARLGGDEFAVLLPAPIDAAGAEAMAGRLLEGFAAPWSFQGIPIPLRSSVGLALCPRDATDAEALLRAADRALYAAKAAGRGCWQAAPDPFGI